MKKLYTVNKRTVREAEFRARLKEATANEEKYNRVLKELKRGWTYQIYDSRTRTSLYFAIEEVEKEK